MVVPDVGLVIVAESWVLTVEQIRISFADAARILSEDSDQRNQFTNAANSGGSDITRTVSRERVVRILSFDGKRVAINSPLGLGRECKDAIRC